MIQQIEFSLTPKRRGFHLVTREILEHLPHPLPKTALLNLLFSIRNLAMDTTRIKTACIQLNDTLTGFKKTIE